MTSSLHENKTVTEWLNGIRIAHRAHIEVAKKHTIRHRVLGSIAAILGAVAATAVFANIRESPDKWVQVAAGAVILASAAITVVNTFLNYSASAAAHRSTSAGYGELRRELEQHIMTGTVTDEFLVHVRTAWTRLDRGAPVMPARVYDRFFNEIVGKQS